MQSFSLHTCITFPHTSGPPITLLLCKLSKSNLDSCAGCCSFVLVMPWFHSSDTSKLVFLRVEKYKLNGRINNAVLTMKVLEGFFSTITTNVGRLDIVIEVYEWTE